MSNEKEKSRTGWLKKGNSMAIAVATGTALAVAGTFGVQAIGDSKALAHMKAFAADGGGWFRGGHHGSRFGDLTDAEIDARVERMVKHVAIEIDATAEQQEKIAALVKAVAKDLKPVRNEMRAAGKQFHDLLLADAIDRPALEKLRAERLAEIERISKNVVNAVADVAEVLSAEQRKILDERIKQFRSMRGWHRG